MSTLILAKQPELHNLAELALVDKAPGNPGVGVTYWGNQYSWKQPVFPQGWFTGVKAPRHQSLANWPWLPGSTGVQVVGDELGISLQSWSLKKDLAARGRLGTIVLGANFKKIYPFRSPYGYLETSFDLKVPSVFTRKDGVAQVVAYYNFTDNKNKRAIWYGLSVFDNRGPSPDVVSWDAGTKTAIVSSSAGVLSELQCVISHELMRRKFNYYLAFHHSISGWQMRNAISLLNKKYPGKYSENLEDYSVAHANLNPEIYVPEGSYAHIGLGVRNWEVAYAD